MVSTYKNLLQVLFKDILQIQLHLEFITLFGGAAIQSRNLCFAFLKNGDNGFKVSIANEMDSKKDGSYVWGD